MIPQNKPTHGHDKEPSKSASAIEHDIGQTRNAITSDIQELSHKLETVVEVKDAVVDKAVEVKDAVMEKAIEVKDAAAETFVEVKEVVSEAMDNVGGAARRMGSATWEFTRANPLPLALMGIGAGWLIASSLSAKPGAKPSLRMTPNMPDANFNEDPDPYLSTKSPNRRQRRAAAQAEHNRPQGSAHAAPGNGAAKRSSERTVEPGRDIKDTLQSTEHMITEGAKRGARSITQGLVRAREASSDFAHDNPMVVAIATVAAGVGVGMLLPSTARENTWLAPARADFKRLIGDAREAATDAANIVKETASDSLHALT